ncbi:pyridoxal phosphate-dependent aminotransferase [Dethiosulfatarculus sandiegensis]|uniref:Aminotransferase n=1 Tax=Dethiosulfatarculus sandiegensis TaxID=1429043 RepID=A0A0D2JVW5_9BACT|nr:pyridoxal phosphate-dependent aminotransferase [Dethiosulfatarculus sandiegensis]KIX13755.1 aminotransferase [Dethiosulfatarculus sandiegensis]
MSLSIPISQRVQQISMSATKEMPILAAKVGDCVSLGQGVPSFATPEHVVKATSQALFSDTLAGKYSLQPGLSALRRAVADYLKAEKQVEYDPDGEVSITVGAMEGLLTAFLTLVDKGDEVILPEPAYASYIEQVLLAEGKPVFVPLNKKDWSLDIEAVKSAVTERTRAIVVCNPGNPTGGVYDPGQVRALAELAREKGIVLISDETYDYLIYDNTPHLSPASLPDMGEHVITINSFSKKYAMTGWRVGYVAAARPLMEQMMKVHDSAAICAPTPSQYAALAAITGPQDVVAHMRSKLFERKELAVRRMRAMEGVFDFVEPRGAFYLLARYLFSSEDSRTVAIQILEQAKVITVPGGSFGPSGEGHLRLSFGATQADLNQAFDRLEQWAAKKKLA